MKKALQGIILVIFALVLVACTPDSKGVKLNVAVNFDGKRFISYNQNNPYEGLDGKTYVKGDLSPTWSAIGENLGIEFFDKGFELAKKNTAEQFEDAKVDGFRGIDLINSTGANITAERNSFVNLKPYIDSGKMPNLKAFLDSQSTYQPYLTASDGGIYYAPYLDGNEEVELGFLMRIDWTIKLLDTDLPGDTVVPAGYEGLKNTTRQNESTLNQSVTVPTTNGTRVVTKSGVNNIIDQLKLAASPANYLAIFRTYMEEVYGDQYDNLSDVFVGYDASYDVDELTALMAVVKANPQLLRGEDNVAVYFPREAKGSRVRNLFRGLEMYGVRGAVSKNNWLYLNDDGELVDARHEDEGMNAFNKLNDLYNDGLILQNFDNSGTDKNHRDDLLMKNNGFLMYDYNATSTAQSIIDAAVEIDKDYRFESILPPVSNWKGDGEYFHFTESVRSLKNEAWGITKTATGEKLEKAIALVDYLYDAEEGADLHLFGPQEWRHATETVEYKGEEIPKFSDKAMVEMGTLGKGNMINYLRDYVGATLPVGHVRSLGVELQTLSEQGSRGYNRVRTAIDAGTFRLIGLHQENGVTPKWYTPVPNVFALTIPQEASLKETKKAFDDFWADAKLFSIVKTGIQDGTENRTNYDKLFIHNNVNWYDTYIEYYQEAIDKILTK